MTAQPAQYLQETAAWTQQTFEVRVPVDITYELLEEVLAKRLERLISEDFSHFVYLLYRIDVAEKKVRMILEAAAATAQDPYKPIAALIIARQLDKIASRAAFKRDDLPDDEERW